MDGVSWGGCRGLRLSSADSIPDAKLRRCRSGDGEATGLVSTWLSMATTSGVGVGDGAVGGGTVSSRVSDLVGGISDTCGDKGVTVSAGGWDSVGRGCEAIALLASGSLVGPVAIGGAGTGPVCGLEVASAGEVAAEAPSGAGERDSAAVGPVEDSVARVDGMGMTEIFGCLLSCADMSVGGLSDGTAGSGVRV